MGGAPRLRARTLRLRTTPAISCLARARGPSATVYRMSRTLLTLALAALGCRDVRVLPNDGGGGTTTVGGQGGVGGEGLGAAGAASPNGGGGTGGVGGEGPFPVPGCEQLVSAGEQVQIVVPQMTGDVRLGAFGDERAGLTYTTGIPGQNATLWSLTVEDAFGDWPPLMIEPAQSQLSASTLSTPGPLETSEDGVFALNFGVRGFFSFAAPGVVRAFEETWLEGFPRTQSEGGALIVSGDGTGNEQLSSLATFSAEPTPIAPLVDGPCRTTRVVHEPEGGAFISRGTEWYCDVAPRADLYRLDGDQLVSFGGFELPFKPHKQFLARREGGYFYAISNPGDGIVVYSLDRSGALVQAPWTDSYRFGDTSTMFTPWRDGFVISRRTIDGISLIVSDGENQTLSLPLAVDVVSSNEEIAMLVGGLDDSSILFAYPQFQLSDSFTIGLFRLDCVTPD